MRLRRLVFVMGLVVPTLTLAACQSTSHTATSASTAGGSDLKALLQENSEADGSGRELEFSAFEERKHKVGEKLSAHLLKTCIVAGAELSDFVGSNLPRCAYEGMSKLVDPSGAVSSHCDDASSKDAYIDCAGNGLVIMRMKSYLKKEMVTADWSGKDAPVDDVSDALVSRLMTVCLAERSGNLGNCMVDKMAGIFEVPSNDASFCKGGLSVETKIKCMGYAAALALFEPRLT